MLTLSQLAEIDMKLREGVMPEIIAGNLGLSYTGFRNALLLSGRKWETVRRLVSTGPASDVEAIEVIQEAVTA